MSSKLVFITSYPPRECGIATYSKDLIHALKGACGNSFDPVVCALESNTHHTYGSPVHYTLCTAEPEDYIRVAREISHASHVKAVFVQHEFGLFGGSYGNYLLLLLYNIQKPVVVTFHTVLPSPNAEIRETVRAIASVSARIIVMTRHAFNILLTDYQLPAELLTIIPHGTHPAPLVPKEKLRTWYKVPPTSRILATFGLLGRGKNIETALDALPDIVREFPDTLYLIIGKTHPEVLKHEGEAYRDFLKARIAALHIADYVQFIDEYVSLAELLEYLTLTDLYLFTSKDPNQAVSGTFVYALSCGCPVVSTPIPHAKELLAANVGRMVDFEQPKQLADATITLLKSPSLMQQMRDNSLKLMAPTVWSRVAALHVHVFKDVLLHSAYAEAH
ncbi:glycosyltransferase [Parapedobacter koreensis]|uniref:Glycosyltransferase involved in cell wall bisynthesis n=1 Tax=Parapedobacter koreensis TaxID=332977 RepID=A0A1H7MYK6_9SPHI|nr:glycosyltransferase [Parapedobacter koreensis]SEL16274.1 Glycosyltransferase involved in cell wall bisynthesis [Parapedobacter koreensis]